jgi:replicative DNA helicase
MESADLPLHKLPPQNLEAEQAVLGAVLLDNAAINKVLEVLTANDFYRESHRRIFKAMLDLSEQNEAADYITVTDYLRRKNLLEQVGGATYLTEILNCTPTAANVRHHAKIVHEKALLRNLITIATEIVSRGYEGRESVDELLDQAENKIFAIADQKMGSGFATMKEAVKKGVELIERLYEKKELVTGVPTGFKELNKLTAGYQPSDLVIIAGRPSMGKTTFALCTAQHVAIDKRGIVAIFSLEMSKEQLVLRMLCSEARVDAQKVRTGFVAPDDWKRLVPAAGRLSEARIFIDDSASISILEMRAKARRLKAEHGMSLVIVDYLQLMRGSGDAESREKEISEISRSLKALAKELQVPVIALSQLSRAVESRNDRRPVLADLRESGAIEQDADVVLFIYREEVYHQTEENRGKAEVIVGKQRNGPIGNVPLTFIDRYTRFENYAETMPI